MSVLKDIPQLIIKVTPKASSKLKEFNGLLNLNNDKYIRIGIKKSGAHNKKIIGVDDKRFTDQQYSFDELLFVIDRRELKHFENIKLDYKESSNQKGFIFRETTKH